MDTSDPDIHFNDLGICNHCIQYDKLIQTQTFSKSNGNDILKHWVNKIKIEGKHKDYDCIIGVSGGVDSSYVAYVTKELELRPLAVHLDNGWDSELAVKNIELLLKKLDIDLYTEVLEWEEFRNLQLAFLRASTPDSEIPTDHAIVALLFQKAKEMNIKYIVNGCNIRTETHLPRSWSQGHADWKYIKNIHDQFGTQPLLTYPHYTFFEKLIYLQRFNWFSILNYLDYSKTDALKILTDKFGWQYYGGKHYESIYTRFFQGYILPKKFGFDKRRTHFSSLICSQEMTRDQALKELQQDPYPQNLVLEDREYVIKKFEITEDEFEQIMALPPKTFLDYPSYDKSLKRSQFYQLLKTLYHIVN